MNQKVNTSSSSPSGSDEGCNSAATSEFAVDDDHQFETLWWRVELVVWCFLILSLICAGSGLLGKGPLSHKESWTADGQLDVRYERIARYKAPSLMTLLIRPEVFHGDKAYVWLSRAVIEKLGTRRIIPQPELSIPDAQGAGYIFATQNPRQPVMISLAQEPESAGVFNGEIRTDKNHDLFLRVAILP